MVRIASLFALSSLASADDEPLKVLFVGNSFTYGPPPYDRWDQLQLNNLPRLFKLVAESKGKKVLVEEDTIGGCTLYQHMPSNNPEACTDPTQCRLVNTTRMPAENGCTVPAAFMQGQDMSPTYHSCPQLLTRQPYGPWDLIVLQDNSALATVQQARTRYLKPAVEEYSTVLKRRQGLSVPRSKQPKIATYMTWSYLTGGLQWIKPDPDANSSNPDGPDGPPDFLRAADPPAVNRSICPGGYKDGCYPLGTLDELSDCNNTNFHEKVATQSCQAYSLARGVAETLRFGADVVVPAGLAWQIARGSEPIPSECKALIDAEYPDAGPLASLDLPLKASNPDDALWRGRAAEQLFRNLGPNYTSPYCPWNCTNDHHPSIIGMYLNSLVFYATLFQDSPIGAAVPDNKTVVDDMVLPAVDPDVAAVLQRIAHDTVMDHMDVWWGEETAYCPWLSDSGSMDKLDCADGSSCSPEVSGWDCCTAHGGRSRCPANMPLMCADTACLDGTEHCCRTDCTEHGGPRACNPQHVVV